MTEEEEEEFLMDNDLHVRKSYQHLINIAANRTLSFSVSENEKTSLMIT